MESVAAAKVDKGHLLDDLAAIEEVRGVFPIRLPQLAGGSRFVEGLLSRFAGTLGAGLFDRATATLDEILLRLGAQDYIASRAFDLVAANEELREQVVGFAESGLAFLSGPLGRSAAALAGHADIFDSGGVTRVLRIGDQLLLETRIVNIQFSPGSPESLRRKILGSHDLLPTQSPTFSPDLLQASSRTSWALDAAKDLLAYDIVEHAAPDFIEFFGQRHVPNDPDYGKQWHLKNNGLVGADIHAEAAWDLARGLGVRIGVIDNGFDALHRDLILGRSSGRFEYKGGKVDATFVRGSAGMPPNDHGTACAGMATARGDNRIGGCGVAFQAELQAVSVDPVGTQMTLARALYYAANPSREATSGLLQSDGADIIACSIGPRTAASWAMKPVLQDAINFAVSSGRGGLGTPVFWATTNGNHPIVGDEVCSHGPVIAVGRSNRTDTHDNTGYGPELALLAPGADVYLPAQGGGYQVITGTSFACPCAAAVGGLVLAANPALSASDVRDILLSTCDKIGNLPYIAGRNDRYGHGRVNAEQAVKKARSYRAQPNRLL